MSRPYRAITCGTCLCLLLMTALAARAEKFDAASIGAETLQSREFDQTSSLQLLRASLAVIQDIGFQVTEAATEPGLIVAQSPGAVAGYAGHVLTVSLAPVPDEDSVIRVRLSLASHSTTAPQKQGQPEYADFYQGFFTHMNRELFRDRSTP